MIKYLLILALVVLALMGRTKKTNQKLPVIGTHTSLELEHKIWVGSKSLSEIKKVGDLVKVEIFRFFTQKNQNNLSRSPFFFDQSNGQFLFEDTYFDTKCGDFLSNNFSTRIRKRYKINKPKKGKRVGWPREKATRIEIQAKKRITLKKTGLIHSQEARLEFAKPEKDQPSHILDINHFQETHAHQTVNTGLWQRYPTSVGKLLEGLFPGRKGLCSSLRPILKLFSLRNRFHVYKYNKDGFGQNKHQVFLVTIDQFGARPTQQKNYVSSTKLPILFDNIEIEIEIERNFLNSRHQNKEAFISLLNQLKDHIYLSLKANNIEVSPSSSSKYSRASKMIHEPG